MGIEIVGLEKRYGSLTALTAVNLEFAEGKIYGLLGRNGAGKTTLLNIIANRIFPDAGQVLVDGLPAGENDRAQSRIFMTGENQLYPRSMQVEKVLAWSKQFYPDFDQEYARNLAKRFGLDLKRKVGALSTGYTSIMKIVVALSLNCPYLLLDEPVLGLDANHRDLFYKLLLERYSQRPATYVISTHLIEEVAGVIEDVVIIDRGKILRNQSGEELVAGGYTVSGRADSVDRFSADKNVIGTDSLGGLKSAYVLGDRPTAIPPDLEISRLDLQKLFIQLTAEEDYRG